MIAGIISIEWEIYLNEMNCAKAGRNLFINLRNNNNNKHFYETCYAIEWKVMLDNWDKQFALALLSWTEKKNTIKLIKLIKRFQIYSIQVSLIRVYWMINSNQLFIVEII